MASTLILADPHTLILADPHTLILVRGPETGPPGCLHLAVTSASTVIAVAEAGITITFEEC